MNIGPTELVIILVIALIVFGPRKLPDLGKSLGQAMAQFRRASDDFKRSWEQEVEVEKSRLGEIKQDLSTGLGYDSAGDDFNYSMDQSRAESDVATNETGATENEVGEPVVESVSGSVSESVGEDATVSDPVTPEPATSTIVRADDSARSETWI